MEPQHEPNQEERDAPVERRSEEEAQRYPGHDAPEETIDPSEHKDEDA